MGRTKSSNWRGRCNRKTSFLFCWQHIWQPLAFFVAVVTFGASITEFSGYSIRDFFLHSEEKKFILTVGQADLSPKDSCEIIFGLSGTEYPAVLNLPLSVQNLAGEKSGEVVVLIKYHGNLLEPWPSDNRSKIESLGATKSYELKRETHTTNGVSSSAIYLKKIGSKKQVFIGEPVVITKKYIDLLNSNQYPAVLADISISSEYYTDTNHRIFIRAVPMQILDGGILVYPSINEETKADRAIVVWPTRTLKKYDSDIYYVGSALQMKFSELHVK